jgi:hypothetical protein
MAQALQLKVHMRALGTVFASLLLLSCGGGSTPDGNVPDGEETATGRGPGASSEGFASQATVGGMDKRAVLGAVAPVLGVVFVCIDDGLKNIPYLGGEVGIFVQVNKSGRATVAFLERSTLGDHETEACIVGAFKKRQWPRPIGGDVGELSQGFDFSAGGFDPPDDWNEGQLKSSMAADAGEDDGDPFGELMGKLSDCNKEAGTNGLDVTMYLDPDGLVQGVGVGMSDDKGHAAVSCVATTVQTTSFPVPGDNFVKVRLRVR